MSVSGSETLKLYRNLLLRRLSNGKMNSNFPKQPRKTSAEDAAREFYKSSAYFLEKYCQPHPPLSKVPRMERTCNIAGYHRKKKFEEFESRVFTGLEDVDEVVLVERHPCLKCPTVVSEAPSVQKKPIPSAKPKPHPKAVRVVLRLKKEHLDLNRLEEMDDKLEVRRMPDKTVRVEATILDS